MPSEITMPQLSDTMTEGTLVKWHKKEGDKIKAGEEIADVETDKATMPMEAFEAGTLAVIAAKEGTKVKVGDLIAVIAAASDNADELRKRYASGRREDSVTIAQKQAELGRGGQTDMGGIAGVQEQTREEGSGPSPLEEGRAQSRRELVHEGPEHTSEALAREASAAVQHARGGSASQNGGTVTHARRGERVLVSPLARRIAQENGIDLNQLQGSGPNGRIVQRDVMALLEGGQPAATAVAPEAPQTKSAATVAPAAKPAAAPLPQRVGTGKTEVVALTKMRSAIATALQRSKQNIPHFYETIDIDVEELSKLRERMNKQLEKANVRLSVADFVHKGVAAALLQHPNLNATFNAEKQEITRYGDVNLGIAVALPEGLIVPVLRNIHQMGLREIRDRSADLVERARAQRLKREESTGATFTVTNLGMYGIREFSAIVNPPEVGILAVGGAEKRPVVRGDQIIARTMMTVTLSADHRVVDGATAAEFLRTLKSLLEEPAMMLV